MVSRIFAFEGDGVVRQYEGGYTDYRAALEERRLIQDTASRDTGPAVKASQAKSTGAYREPQGSGRKSWKDENHREKKLKFSFKEQKEWETIEADMAKLETDVAGLEEEIQKAARDYGRLNQLMREKEEKEVLLEEKMERWIYLNDLEERIRAQQ